MEIKIHDNGEILLFIESIFFNCFEKGVNKKNVECAKNMLRIMNSKDLRDMVLNTLLNNLSIEDEMYKRELSILIRTILQIVPRLRISELNQNTNKKLLEFLLQNFGKYIELDVIALPPNNVIELLQEETMTRCIIQHVVEYERTNIFRYLMDMIKKAFEEGTLDLSMKKQIRSAIEKSIENIKDKQKKKIENIMERYEI